MTHCLFYINFAVCFLLLNLALELIFVDLLSITFILDEKDSSKIFQMLIMPYRNLKIMVQCSSAISALIALSICEVSNNKCRYGYS